MAKSLLLSLLVLAVQSAATQAASYDLSPKWNANAISASSVKDKFSTSGLVLDGGNDIVHDDGEGSNNIVEEVVDDSADDLGDDVIVEEVVDDSADDLADDVMVEEQLTEQEKLTGDNHVEFPVRKMDDEELKMYLGLEEQIFWAEADEHIAFQLLKDKQSLFTKGGDHLRRKRIVPLIARAAFTVARGLARRFSRSGITRSGSRVTRHYNGRGSYGDAVRDFNRMRPSNVRSFDNGRISGRTGTMGRHRVTVRDGSSGNSRPTLEIRSHGGDLVRKFRYHD